MTRKKYKLLHLFKTIGLASLCLASQLGFANDNINFDVLTNRSSGSPLDFITTIEYPELNNGTVFKPTFSHTHKLLFYTGQKDGENVSGYFRSRHFLGWSQYNFPALEPYKTKVKGVLDVSNGPLNKTVTLSYIDGVGQLLSSSRNGKSWESIEITAANDYFDALVNTNAHGIERVIAYGQDQSLFLSSSDGIGWQSWAFPNPCQSKHHCFYKNQYFDSVGDGYVLLQAKTHESIDSNALYFTSNLQNWYRYEVPFKDDFIEKVFKSKYDVLLASVISGKDEQSHKLWLSPNHKEWVSYDLPSNAEVVDAQVDNKNHIAVLLVYRTPISSEEHAKHLLACTNDGECPPCPCEEHHDKDGDSDTDDNNAPLFKITTELVIIDPETKANTVFEQFDGLVSGMQWFENKLYLSGDFINKQDKKHAALISIAL